MAKPATHAALITRAATTNVVAQHRAGCGVSEHCDQDPEGEGKVAGAQREGPEDPAAALSDRRGLRRRVRLEDEAGVEGLLVRGNHGWFLALSVGEVDAG